MCENEHLKLKVYFKSIDNQCLVLMFFYGTFLVYKSLKEINKAIKMDKIIQPKKKIINKKTIWISIGVLIIALMSYNITRPIQANIKKSDIRIKEVKKGDFEDAILFNSTVEPKSSILVNIVEGGSISEVYAENGQMVKEGTPLLKVYNPNATLNYMTQETAIIEQMNNLRNIRMSVKNQQLTLAEQQLKINNDFANAKRQFQIDSVLYNKHAVSKFELETSTQEYKFQSQRFDVINKSVSDEKVNRKEQLVTINQSLDNMEKSLGLLRINKENFVVKAPKTGLLSSFNPGLGQSFSQGQSIGKIDVLDGYKLVAKVDEYYISKLREGIKGVVQIEDETFEIELSKINPEVVGGQFEVSLNFKEDQLPELVKRGMSLKSKLFLSGNTKALLLAKGSFYQETNGQWAYVLTENNKAEKQNIKIGRENPFYYEVLEGLEEGDRVITSTYKDYKNIELLNLK